MAREAPDRRRSLREFPRRRKPHGRCCRGLTLARLDSVAFEVRRWRRHRGSRGALRCLESRSATVRDRPTVGNRW